MPGQFGRPSGPALVAGTSAVLLSVGCGKWASYLGTPPVYSTDVLLAGGALLLVLSGLPGRDPTGGRPTAGRAWPGLALSAFACLAILRFAVSNDHSLTAVRDFAPYGYALVAFLSARSFASASPAALRRTARLVEWTLVFHLAWFGLVELVPSIPDSMPMIDPRQDLHVFSVRASTDATVVGVTAAIFLMKYFRSGRWHHLAVFAVASTIAANTGTRAALLAMVSAFAVTMGILYFGRPDAGTVRRRALATAVLPVTLLVGTALLPRTVSGSKLLAGLGVTRPRSELDRMGIGTARGRDEAWHLVVDYVNGSGHGTTGVGFGPDYLFDAHARLPLGGNPLLRSPHNYLVNTWARLGTVGLVLLALLLAAAAREAVRARAVAGSDSLVLFATVFPAAFLTNALFGVELETPFGAVPFFWCLGILLARPARPPGPAGPYTVRGDTDVQRGGDPGLPQSPRDHAAVPTRAVLAGPPGDRAARGPRG